MRFRLAMRMKMSTRMRMGMKLRELLAMPDREFAHRVRRLEGHPLFKRLMENGVLSLQRYPRPRSLPVSYPIENNPEPINLDGRLQVLIQRMGERNFTDCFLGYGTLTDQDRARICDVSVADAANIRMAVDRTFVQDEFVAGLHQAPPRFRTQLIGGVEIQNGRPVLSFYQRDIWSGRYWINDAQRLKIPLMFSGRELDDAESLLSRLRLVNYRTANLYKAVELLLDLQADYISSEERDKLKPVSQRELARKISVDSSSLNRLLRGRSLRLPSGRETTLLALLPGRKSVLKDRLYTLLTERPDLTEEELTAHLRIDTSLKISRRSVAMYRKELGFPCHRNRISTGTLSGFGSSIAGSCQASAFLAMNQAIPQSQQTTQ